MMVGPSGSGKSTAWRVLLKALERLEGVEGVAHVIDPKVGGWRGGSLAYCYVRVIQIVEDFDFDLSECLRLFVTAIVVTVRSALEAVGLH